MSRKPTYSTRSLRVQRLVRAALLVLIPGLLLTGRVCGAEDAADPYDTLYDVIMTRDGRSYAEDETSPLIFPKSHFPFGDKTYNKLDAALDAFAALPQEKIEAYSDIKRALLQRHLWKVYDASHPIYYINHAGKPDVFYKSHRNWNRRTAVRPKIASLIHRLALTRAQILALPNTLTATVKSGGFAESHDPDELFKPFLPPDLYAKESSWICQGDAKDPVPADVHSKKFKWRSTFLSFLRAPGGRAETLKCVEKFNRAEALPLGTQSALIEQAFLISDEGEPVLSPLIVSISLRAYVGVHTQPRRTLRATQCVAEFLMQPRQLIQGNAVMRALTPTDHRFEAGDVSGIEGGTQDPFEYAIDTVHPRLTRCMRCHGGASRIGLHTTRPPLLQEVSPKAIGRATSARKRDHNTWKALHKVWQVDSAKRDAQSPARADQPQPPLDSKESTTRGAEDAADPYDVLYDVLMTRYGKDGKSYAENETSPVIFKWSDFPFGDKTFKKFNAALDAFAALPQAKIEAYSDVKRALLQRHLWKVVDATIPVRWQLSGKKTYGTSHLDRRDAVRPKIASLIQRLALSRARILELPDTMAATVKSGGVALLHDPRDRFKPFLPADLYSKESSWICFGEDYRSIPADIHSRKLNWRSAFLQFMRVPGGRIETLKYMEKLNNHKEIFPVGTQFALIEQAFLISDEGELILSPLIVSIQLRAYLDVNQSVRDVRPEATQCVAEFLMQPRQLMQGNAVMKALNPRDHRYEAGDDADGQSLSGGAKDPFETGEMPITRLNLCMRCHGPAGLRSVQTIFNNSFPLLEASHQSISKATSTQKRADKTWKALQELWQADSRKNDARSPAPADQPQPPLDNKESTTRAAEDAADPYDVLYDVIMTRYGPDGKSYGANESSPAIFKGSNFPFDDRTYKKLDEALDAFGALPQTEIEASSDIQRALMQRHLWHVFDATAPHTWMTRDRVTGKPRQVIRNKSYQGRRDAMRPKIASAIQRLALTKARILALPDTRAVTVESGGFLQRHDPTDPSKPFLPADLFSKESSWVCIGFEREPPAPVHSEKVKFRSAFLTFMQLPGGRSETLEYMARVKKKVEQFPVGTQFAFIEQAFLISDEGEMILSPLIVSISMRAYLDVDRGFHRTHPPTQSLAEFVTQPRQLMQGNAVMKALGQRDLRFEAGDAGSTAGVEEPFEKRDELLTGRRGDMLRTPRLELCMSCHGGRGVETIAAGAGLFGVKESSPEEIVKATLTYKRDDHTWKTLSELWQAESKKPATRETGSAR